MRSRKRRYSSKLLVLLALGLAPATAVALPACHIENDTGVLADTCSGTLAGGLCSEPFFKDIPFEKPFSEPPNVLVTIERISAQSGCVLDETDTITCYPENISTDGFRLRCAGSPVGVSCGTISNYYSKAKAQWLAVDASPACGTESEHQLAIRTCETTVTGDVCKGSFSNRRTWKILSNEKPHVLVAAEEVGTHTACSDEGTDKLLCWAKNPDTEKFQLECSGSVIKGLCPEVDNNNYTPTKAGYLAIHAPPNCAVASAHFVIPDKCEGKESGFLCLGEKYVDVRFKTPFSVAPYVIVAPENASSGPACSGGAMDGIYCRAENISGKGFRAYCGASPKAETCGAESGSGSVQASFGFLAISRSCGEVPLQ